MNKKKTFKKKNNSGGGIMKNIKDTVISTKDTISNKIQKDKEKTTEARNRKNVNKERINEENLNNPKKEIKIISNKDIVKLSIGMPYIIILLKLLLMSDDNDNDNDNDNE